VAEHLSEHGLMVQWFPLATLHSDLRTILVTLCTSFPNVDAFCFPPASLLLVAGNEPLDARPLMGAQTFARLPIAERLATYGMDCPAAVASNWVAGRAALLRAAGPAPVSTWDKLILDISPFKASSDAWHGSYLANLRMLVEAGRDSADSPPPSLPPEEVSRFESMRLLREAWLASLMGRMRKAQTLAQRAVEVHPDNLQAQAFAASLASGSPGGR